MSHARATVLFIGGAGRSGSTLLECMLDQVPGITAAGEVTHLWQRGMCEDQLCGCGSTFGSCPFWKEIMRRTFAGGAPSGMALARLRRRALAPAPPIFLHRARRRYLAVLASLYRAVAAESGSAVVVDSSKYPPEAWLLRSLTREGIRIRYVHLVREPRAVVHSWRRKRVRPEIHDRIAYMPRYPWWQTTGAWITYNALFDILARFCRGAVLRVRYEDLVEQPAAVLGRVAAHAGIPGPCLPFIRGNEVTLAANHTVSGNPSRFRAGAVELLPDTEWRERLPRPIATVVRLLTAVQRRRYGYS